MKRFMEQARVKSGFSDAGPGSRSIHIQRESVSHPDSRVSERRGTGITREAKVTDTKNGIVRTSGSKEVTAKENQHYDRKEASH
jgi:hypothetical protein